MTSLSGSAQANGPIPCIRPKNGSLPHGLCVSGLPFNRVQGQLLTCPVEELRPHPGYVRHHITVPTSRLSPLAELGDLAFLDPLLITRDRTILDGYARWRLARERGLLTLPCIEYDLPEAEALFWLLQKHRRSNGLNAFTRTILALELEPWLKEQARSNQRAGGQNKGSSKLTEVDKLDVRMKIAVSAGVSAGNVSKVKKLVMHAPLALLQALREGEVSIHRASVWLLTPEKQLDHLTLHRNTRGIRKTINSLLRRHRITRPAGEGPLDIQRIARGLTAMKTEQSASVLVGEIPIPGNVVLLSRELLRALESQGELDL